MSVRQDAILTQDDLLSIEDVLYETKSDEMVARLIAKPNTNFEPYAKEVGYDWYDRKGSAKILANGGSAKDVPFVGESGGRVTATVYDIVTGIRYERAELMAMQAKRALGKGPNIALDTLRVKTARRFVAEKENKLFFVGDAKFNIKGILNKAGITVEDVAQGAIGSYAAAKRLWANKTPKEILKDLLRSKEVVEGDGLFKARVLILTPGAYIRLQQPYSDQSLMTVMSWLKEEGAFFDKVIPTRAMAKTENGFTTDAFAVLDNDPEVVELAIPQELELLDPVYDILGNSEQVVDERTAGPIIRHPSAIYVGKGI